MAQSAPDWMMLDRFVYHKDDAGFPEESMAPLRATSSTSLGQAFDVALLPAEPPAISRLYVRWPGGKRKGIEVVTAHHDLLLLRLTSVEYLDEFPYRIYTQDHFICISSCEAESHLQLKRLPVCNEPVIIPPKEDEAEETIMSRKFEANTVGLVRRPANVFCGYDVDFSVAQLANISEIPNQIPGIHRMEAEVCVLRSRLLSGDDQSRDSGVDEWQVKKIAIQHTQDEFKDLWHWSTNNVITCNNDIYWIDYYRGGILVYNALSNEPRIVYLRFPISNRPKSSTVCQIPPEMNRSVCVTRDMGLQMDVLRMIDVARTDGYLFGKLKLGYGFTIKCSTLSSDGWVEDVNIASQDLWDLNTSAELPHDMLMFPLMSMQNFNIVNFLVSQYLEQEEIDKVSVVTLDVSKKKVLAITPYIAGQEDADMIKEKSSTLTGFLSSSFPFFFNNKPVGTADMQGWAFASMSDEAGGSGTK